MDIVSAKRSDLAAEHLLDQMFRLRARVFGERLEWDVNVTNGYEEDQFDEMTPSYLLAVTNEDRVVGCARLLPAIGPTMLETVFPFLLSEERLMGKETMVESSRFCVDTNIARDNARLLHDATLSLFSGIIEWSISQGYNRIVTATDLRFERLLRHAGWPLQRLGTPHKIGNVDSIAGILTADNTALSTVRPLGYRLRNIAAAASLCGKRHT